MKRTILMCPIVVFAVGVAEAVPTGVAMTPDEIQVGSGATAKKLSAVLSLTDSLRKAGAPQAALTRADSGLASVRQLGDSVLVTRFLTDRGRSLIALGRALDAEPVLDEAIVWAEALRDTSLLCDALDQLCFAVDAQGRPPRVVPLLERLVATAAASGDTLHLARGHLLLGRRSMQVGEFDRAQNHLEGAHAAFEGLDDERNALNALNMLALLAARQGRYDIARQHWTQCQISAQRLGYTYLEANVLLNLGILQLRTGDPSLAPPKLLRAHQALLGIGRLREAVHPAVESAVVLMMLGRYEDAEPVLQQQLRITREQGYSDLEARIVGLLGELEYARGRPHASARFHRRALALADSSELVTESSTALVRLSQSLCAQDSVAQALQLFEQRAPQLRRAADRAQQLRLDGEWARVLLQMQRPAAALERLGDFETRAVELDSENLLVQLLPLAAAAQRQLQRPGPALEMLQRAAVAWESQRSKPRDLEWREQRGAQGARIYTELARALLDPPGSGQRDDALATQERARRTEEAYDILQRFKARTLLERMSDPAGSSSTADSIATPVPVTLAELQETTLRDGELLLDAFVGPDVSWMFAVTRHTCRVTRLPGLEDDLQPRLELIRSLLTTPPSDVAGAVHPERPLAAARGLLVGSFVDELQAADRVVFIPDGPLNLLPLGVLLRLAEGTAPVELVRHPSATVLAHLRRNDDTPGGSHRILALAGAVDAHGSALPGAARESLWLQRRFREVSLVQGDEDSLEADDLVGYDVLHLAAHTFVDDQNPWRSGIVLSGTPPLSSLRAADDERDARILRAGVISTLSLDARMAVLSGCESASGQVLSGEGILGLTAAFLSAGVPVIVATLWPVDDAVTARLMKHFYEHLQAGETVTSALRGAQQAIRSRAVTRHPFYWGGFVVVGQGDLRVDLLPRESPRSIPIVLSLVVLTAFGVLGARAWRRRSGSFPAHEAPLTKDGRSGDSGVPPASHE